MELSKIAQSTVIHKRAIVSNLMNYIQHFLKAKSKHGIHSPFVYKLVTEVLQDKTKYAHYTTIEALRGQLLKNDREIEVTDLGAGSKRMKGNHRKVRDIARYSAKNKKCAQLIYRLVKHLNPTTVLELGTSLGVTTAYMALAQPDATLTTLEGCPNTAQLARNNLTNLGIMQTQVVVGNFDQTLPRYLNTIESLDFVFFDGNHQKGPSIAYFEACLPKANNNSVFVFDDIHWTKEMEKFWEYVKAHEQVQVSIDLFELGIVFFRKEQAREHFTIRY